MKCVIQNYLVLGLAILLSGSGVARTQAAATVTIQAQPGAAVSSNLFGIFFEEINFAGDGGIYGELVRNRSFAESADPDFWTLATTGTAAGTMRVDPSVPLNPNHLNSLQLSKTSGSGMVSAVNGGYWGIPLKAGATYDLNFYARGAAGFSGSIIVRLQDASGSSVYGQFAASGLSTNWQKFSASLVANTSDTKAQLALSISSNGTVWLGEVSLFPHETFNVRANGLRPDLAAMLAALHPSFMRYPGGNFIESWNVTNAVRWKKTIGDPAARPGHLNDSWGYWSTDGYGLDEAFRQCEDLGMQLLYGLNSGLCLGYNGSPNNTVPLDQMGPWVQDALDLIQYANGDTNTTWGAVRAANGHPAPYHLQYVEIGNESGGSLYDERYALFYDAIKFHYPDVHVVASEAIGNLGAPATRPAEMVDEHYYTDPATFISLAHHYDSYSRGGPKVFVGEYAVWSGFGTYGNLAAALGEATFMTGLERNSDIVTMASYAPLFGNVNGLQWRPDLIYYDNSQVFGTPSYYVQKMFSNNRGDAVLPVSVIAPATTTNPPPQGAIGVGTWNTAVQYTNIVVTSNGVTLYQSDFLNQGANGWRVHNGTWSVTGGVYQQTATATTDCRSTTGSTDWANYTISLRARKTGGSEGFLILFNWQDDNNWTWLNLGGWNNTQHGLEQCVNGSKTILGSQVFGSISNNQWYDITIVLTGRRIQCYLNNTLVQDATYASTSPYGLYASSTYDQRDRQVIVKVVNPYHSDMATTFNLAGVAAGATNATLIQLTSASATDENSFAAPTKVSPVTNSIGTAGTNLMLTLPANSLSILRWPLPTPLPPAGLNAVANGWQVALSWAAYASATNYVLKRATASAGPFAVIAVTNGTAWLDQNVHPGTTYYYTLSALLPSEQTPDTTPVSVMVGASLRAWLPFDEGAGAVANDVTGHGWNGTLIGNPAWVNGYRNTAVSLNGSGQYVSLPDGAVSNLNDFSIAAWVNVSALATWDRFFDFGTGTSDYLFLTPDSGAGTWRFGITTNGNTAEQQLNGPAGFPTGGWHHVAVTASAGTGILYLDGGPVATNSGMTLTPARLGVTTQNWIGRSEWSLDPYLTGAVDDFRIYSGALSAGDVATFLNPLAAPTGLTAVPADGSVGLSWNPSLNANGYDIAASTNLAGPYLVKASRFAGLTFTDTNVQNGWVYFYVVAATNTVGGSTNSAPVSVRPVSSVPPKLVAQRSGSQVQFSWPQDHTGWRLQVQTNDLQAGLGANWFDLPEATATNLLNRPMNPLNRSVFYRLVYP